MNSNKNDRVFAGSIPNLYEQYMVPMLFEPYAEDLAARVAALRPTRVLEIAAGTGVVTRRLAAVLGPEVSIVATDLNQPMLDLAAALGTARQVQWRQADAMQLPFDDATFDVVVCQFGAMFFPDKSQAFAEARRVLTANGTFIFNVWDRLEHNEFGEVVLQAVADAFPSDPPQFIARIPHGYYDCSVIARDLASGGFDRSPTFTTVTARSRAASARIPAVAICQGTPLRSEIEARDAARLDEITDMATAAVSNRFGSSAVDGKMQAHIVVVEK